jgi:phosphotransferase system enzyme I (PtsP)
MFPLVATVAEFKSAREIVFRELDRAKRVGQELPREVKVGTMLEVPALVWQLDSLLPLVDFLSIGTNDLLQFLFAVDRGNARVGQRYDFLDISVLNILRFIREKCASHSVPVSICGELVGQPLEAMAAIGLGFKELSVPAPSIGPVKRMVRSVNHARLSHAVAQLVANGPADIRQGLRAIAQAQGIKL